MKVLRLIDSVFERIADHLAGNFCENLEAFEQNQCVVEDSSNQSSAYEREFVLEV